MSRYSYFKSELSDLFVISDEIHKETFPGMDNEYNCSRIVRKLNILTDENEELKNKIIHLEEDLRYYKSKSASCEEGLISQDRDVSKLKKENEQLKQQFILLLKKLGKKNVQCSFCEHGEHYSELVDGYYEPRFICHKKGQEYTQRSFCEDWKIKVIE